MSTSNTPTTTERYFAIADIHGEYEKLLAVIDLIKKEAGYDPAKDHLVQLGDKNDRGKKTYEVIQYFYDQCLMYPETTHCLMGNHELLMLESAEMKLAMYDWYLPNNGGNATLQSYSDHTKLYGKRSLSNSLGKTGHRSFILKHPYYLETDQYFFCHAPIPRPVFRRSDRDFRQCIDTLTWSFNDVIPEVDWVDQNLIPGKLTVHGHLHGIKRVKMGWIDTWPIPGVRKYGNAVFLDTGCGCLDEAWLSCLELPAMKIYDSRGQIYDLQDTP